MIKKLKIILCFFAAISVFGKNLWAVPPDQITTLTASSGNTDGSITVSWMNPSFSITSGGVQDLKWNTVPIDESNWSLSTSVSPLTPAPTLISYYNETYVVPGLNSHAVLYYFAVKTNDNLEGWSVVSNVASSYSDVSPSAITTLTISPLVGGQAVKLQWLAPGDDGTVGNLYGGYKIRYKTSPILSESDWNSATEITDIDYWNQMFPPTPALSFTGEIQTAYSYGLTAGSNLYFAVKAFDDLGNYSDISNSTFTYIFTGTSGEGTATIVPSSAAANSQITSTITFTVGSTPIGPGGELAISIPPGWTAPTTAGGMSGYVSFSTISGQGTGTLTIGTTGQLIIITCILTGVGSIDMKLLTKRSKISKIHKMLYNFPWAVGVTKRLLRTANLWLVVSLYGECCPAARG